MTSSEIRQSFLDFFEEKQHAIVPSASLMPGSPNLLFTNAGMNQFIPYFLGTEAAPWSPPRAADTQKCIRAGGKHNDLEDVGYDTYHHTFFEMLGNWSFGDYFKKEAIAWAWELLTERWGLPPQRLYATVYSPGEGEPASFDQEAHDLWAAIFERAGLDPAVHIVNGDKKDNFWMMGDTGPCGPCSEIHMDLTPAGDTGGRLVNADDARCIEIWNLVFIQFNANEDGSFRPLPACHVDTGMGFERICSVIQGTRGLADFSVQPSNYDTDVFSPLFAKLSELSGMRYTSTLPEGGRRHELSEQERIDVAFRVIGDHLRAAAFSVADGIEPGNGGRNYVVRNILRRAVRFGRVLGFEAGEPFLHRLAPVLVQEFGAVFPELEARRDKIADILRSEEEQFNRTLDRGLKLFDEAASGLGPGEPFPAATVVKLWETYGFPTDLTRLLLDERSLRTDEAEVERLVEAHRGTGAEGRQTQAVEAVSIRTEAATEFVGYDRDESEAEVLEWIESEEGVFAVVDRSPFYIEKGGQVGDTGVLEAGGETVAVTGCFGVGEAAVLQLERRPAAADGPVTLRVESRRRREIEKHHTATHLFHWALHEVVSPDATQQGSLVAPDRLRFDFNAGALDGSQIERIEEEVNRRILADDPVSVVEVPHREIKNRPGILQFFGDKYGDRVRVVQIGGEAGALDGYSMELCGGTHTRSTGPLRFFKIKSEGAVAAGIRRVEAVCGAAAADWIAEQAAEVGAEIEEASAKLESANRKLAALQLPPAEAEAGEDRAAEIAAALEAGDPARADALLARLESRGDLRGAILARADALLARHRARRDALRKAAVRAEKAVKKAAGGAAAAAAARWYEETLGSAEGGGYAGLLPEGDPSLLQEALNTVKARGFRGAVALALVDGTALHLGAAVHPDFSQRLPAGELVREALAVAGGKGGGRPEMARGAAPGGSDRADEVLAKAGELLENSFPG